MRSSGTMRALPWFGAMVVLSVGQASALDVDVKSQIDQRLAAKGDFSLPDSCGPVNTGTRSRFIPSNRVRTHNMDIDSVGHGVTVQEPIMQTQCVPQIGKLTATSVSAVELSFDKLDLKKNDLPTRVRGQSVVSMNCSESEQRLQTQFEFTSRYQTTTTTTRGITNVIGVNTKVSFKYADSVGGEFGGSFTHTVSQQTADQTVRETSEKKIVTVPIVISQMTNFTSQGKILESTDRLYWHASVVVDGPLVANKSGKANISDILPVGERTFEIEGYIENVASSDIVVDYFSDSLTKDQCNARTKSGQPLTYRVDRLVNP